MNIIDRLSRNIERTIVAFIIIISCTVLYISIKDIEKSTRQTAGKSLEATLFSFKYSVHLNIEQRINYLKSLSNDESLKKEIQFLLKKQPEIEHIILTKEYKKIKKELAEFVLKNNDIDFYLVSKNKKIYASLNEENILDTCALFNVSQQYFEKIIAGETIFIPPTNHYMYIGSPVFYNKDSLIGAIIIKMHAAQIFNPASQLGRIGYSGKSYIIDKKARILSQSRFGDALKAKGIGIGTHKDITDIRVADPGQNIEHLNKSINYDTLPLTLMAQNLTQGINGREINGYNDYRGVRVMGAWAWDEKLHIGFVCEIDENEALSAFYHTRRTIIIVLGIAIFVTVILIYLIGKMRQRNVHNLKYLNSKLEKKVTERTLALEEANKTKDKFLNIISHDLRGQMGALTGLLNIICKDFDSADPTYLKNALRTLQKTADNTFSLLSNLLEWSRSQQGQIKVNKEAVEIIALIKEIEMLFKQQMDMKNLKFQFFYENDIYVYADTNMLKTIFRNIVSNAIKFTQNEGEITIVVKQSIYDNILVTVKDNGIGMSKEEADAIFLLNKKTQKDGTNNEPGSGFGLKLCKDFIIKNNGTIWVESTQGKGATVSFLLPEYKKKIENETSND